MDHIERWDLEALGHGRLDPEKVRLVLRHLISGCEICRRLLTKAISETSIWRQERPPDDSYDAAIERAWKKTRKLLPRLNQDQERKDRGLDLLRAKGGWEQISGPEQRSFQGAWPHVEILLQQSFDLRFRDPKEMLHLVETAQKVVDGLEPWPYGETLLFDLRSRVWGELGNAFRVNEKYSRAEAAFQTAQRLLDQGTGDLFLRAHLYDMESSLHRAQHRFEKALALLNKAHHLYRKLGDHHLVARTLMRKGHCLYYARRPQEAVKWLRQALPMLDFDVQLFANAQQLLLDALVDAGKFREAGSFLLESGLGLAFADDPLNLRRLRWVEAKILAGRGRLSDAERVFEEVRAGFREQDLRFDAALVGVDLALVLLKQGKDIHHLSAELSRECRSHGINPEAVKAFKSFEILCRHKGATVPLVEKLRDFLVQLQDFPKLRFEPELVFG